MTSGLYQTWLRTAAALGLILWLGGCATAVTRISDETRPTTVGDALLRLFNAEQVEAVFFTPSNRDTGLVERVSAIRDEYLSQYGPVRSVREDERFWLLEFDEAIVPVFATLDDEGGFVMLWVNIAEPLSPPTLTDIEGVLDEFGGTVSLYIEREGRELFAREADTPLAVGSAFKVAVLQALRAQQSAGRIAPDRRVRLREHHKSLPSGRLHLETAGKTFTLGTLTEAMIAESDNTATDMLIDLVGAESIESLTPRNSPFLTTVQFFKLKDPAQADLRATWQQGDPETRRDVLSELEQRPLPPLSIFGTQPLALDIEWFISAREMCGHLRAVGFDWAMTRNAAQLDRSRWSRVAYKGGSEPGVFHQSFLLQDSSGRVSCAIGTWNNPEGMVSLPFIRLMSHMARLARELP
ncbi:MAG: serine hydrolase [Pseudomonadota bacterium]